jgi:hypothetical protein
MSKYNQKQLSIITLVVVIGIQLLGLFGVFITAFSLHGCSHPIKPKAYLQVTKPPLRVTYFDFEKDISPDFVMNLTRQVSGVKYQNYKFNNTQTIDIRWDARARKKDEVIRNITIQGNK